MVLPTNLDQKKNENGMKLNFKKTKLILFNPGMSLDFLPKFNLNDKNIEMGEEVKLIGVIIRSDLSWSSNTDYLVTRANSKLWFLRRLKALGPDQEDLKDIYIKQIRSILEFAVPVWHSSLTGEDRLRIERIQTTAMHIILGSQYKSYTSALNILVLDPLFTRRQKLCRTFAKKCYNSAKFQNWFQPNTKPPTRHNPFPNRLCSVYSRLKRFERSPISYMTELLNMMKFV